MRRLTVAIAFILTGITSAFAYDSPKELLEALYAPYFQGENADWDKWHEEDFRSKALNALFAKDAAETPEGDVGRIDFDPYVDGQDFELTDFKIGEAVVIGDLATVEVTFKNFDEKEDIFFSLVKEDGGWKIDDVEARGNEYPYKLTALLTAPLDDEND